MKLPADADISAAFELIAKDLDCVKELISRSLSTSTPFVNQLLAAFDTAGGKLIRPALVLLSAKACGNLTCRHIQLAAIIQILHAATLLHDDVLDRGHIRRGKPTINILWGNESAILLGDFLLSKVLQLAAQLPPEILAAIGSAADKLCRGELSQIAFRQNPARVTEARYIKMIADKTASLFSASCVLGAKLAGASADHAAAFARFGQNLGIAFQLTDDVLDLVGTETATGKTLGSDAAGQKLTLPVIHLLSLADKKTKTRISDAFRSHTAWPHLERLPLAKLLGQHHSLEHTRKLARRFTKNALAAIEDFSRTPAKKALIQIANFVARRGV